MPDEYDEDAEQKGLNTALVVILGPLVIGLFLVVVVAATTGFD